MAERQLDVLQDKHLGFTLDLPLFSVKHPFVLGSISSTPFLGRASGCAKPSVRLHLARVSLLRSAFSGQHLAELRPGGHATHWHLTNRHTQTLSKCISSTLFDPHSRKPLALRRSDPAAARDPASLVHTRFSTMLLGVSPPHKGQDPAEHAPEPATHLHCVKYHSHQVLNSSLHTVVSPTSDTELPSTQQLTPQRTRSSHPRHRSLAKPHQTRSNGA